MTNWQILHDKENLASFHMEKDAKLLVGLTEKTLPILRFYDWLRPSFTYGYFTAIETHIHLDRLDNWSLDRAKRPTGGGIVFHTTDLAFSILIPAHHPNFSINTLENYGFINKLVANVIQKYTKNEQVNLLVNNQNVSPTSFCMAKPTIYDVVLGNKKVGGAAQRKTKQGFLHQGTISICLPSQEMLKNVLKDEKIFNAMQDNSYYLEQNLCQKDLEEVRDVLRKLLVQEVTHSSITQV